MKRPVILGIRGHSRRMLEEADAGIAIDPEDGAALAEAARRLAGNPEIAAIFGAQGARFVHENFSRSALAEKYASLMQSLLQDAGSPAAAAAESLNAVESAPHKVEQKPIPKRLLP